MGGVSAWSMPLATCSGSKASRSPPKRPTRLRSQKRIQIGESRPAHSRRDPILPSSTNHVSALRLLDAAGPRCRALDARRSGAERFAADPGRARLSRIALVDQLDGDVDRLAPNRERHIARKEVLR